MEQVFKGYTLVVGHNGYTKAVKNVVFNVLREYGLEPSKIDFCLEDVETHYLNNKGYFVVLLDADQTVVGTGGLYRIDDQNAELRKMYLLADHRGKGLGKLLLNTLLDKARTLGYERIELETASVLMEAIGLYKKHGFQAFYPDHIADRCDQAYELIL